MKKILETQFPDVIPDEDAVFVRNEEGEFVELEVADDETDN